MKRISGVVFFLSTFGFASQEIVVPQNSANLSKFSSLFSVNRASGGSSGLSLLSGSGGILNLGLVVPAIRKLPGDYASVIDGVNNKVSISDGLALAVSFTQTACDVDQGIVAYNANFGWSINNPGLTVTTYWATGPDCTGGWYDAYGLISILGGESFCIKAIARDGSSNEKAWSDIRLVTAGIDGNGACFASNTPGPAL